MDIISNKFIEENSPPTELSAADRDALEIAYIIQRNADNAAFMHKLLVRAMLLEKLYPRKQ